MFLYTSGKTHKLPDCLSFFLSRLKLLTYTFWATSLQRAQRTYTVSASLPSSTKRSKKSRADCMQNGRNPQNASIECPVSLSEDFL